MKKKTLAKGFTLVELLVVVVIIGILAAIALPNFIGAQKKAKASAVRGNMRTTQVAAETFATDNGGVYAAAADAGGTGPYYPGGEAKTGGAIGTYPQNPITGTTNEAPKNGGPGTQAAVNAARAAAPAGGTGAGTHTYDPVDVNLGYSVTGSDADNVQVSGTGGKTMVLSNF